MQYTEDAIIKRKEKVLKVKKSLKRFVYILLIPLLIYNISLIIQAVVKPNETPYKSVMVSVATGQFDMNGLEIIELALQSCKKFQFRSDKYAPHVYEDFRIIDCTLIESGCESADLW